MFPHNVMYSESYSRKSNADSVKKKVNKFEILLSHLGPDGKYSIIYIYTSI